MLSDDELYLACLLAIGPWDWKVNQTEFLMGQLNRKLGRKATIDEGIAFINGYRAYTAPQNGPYFEAIGKIVLNSVTKHEIEKIIDTHTVGK